MNSTATLAYGLLIYRIIFDSLVDLCTYRPTFIDAACDTQIFLSMDYVLMNEKWYKKESVQSRSDIPWATRISADSATLLLKEAGHINVRLDGLECYVLKGVKGK
ncbi:hypothetical protein EJD97_025637 [Solanum chilense]|uniref:Uncharacterized protein n=1 Tax=Solanum chilense TaxID=4083 RepID=A0A6N2AR15_SOLCI|nr:hypothetical protein EJD97_025637 [Solanum chilense]